MEPAHGRRLSRLGVTLWVAVPALLAVALRADPDWARVFSFFVLLTVVALPLAALGSRPDEE